MGDGNPAFTLIIQIQWNQGLIYIATLYHSAMPCSVHPSPLHNFSVELFDHEFPYILMHKNGSNWS